MFFISLVVGVVVLLYWYITRNRNYWKNRGVQLASGRHWFFGHVKDFLFMKRNVADVFKDIYDENPDAPYVGFMRFQEPGLFVRDLDMVKDIFSTNFSSFNANDAKINKKRDFLLGYNPFFLQGEEWKTVRSHATPLTTFTKLKNYAPTIRNVGDEMVKYIKRKQVDRGLAELETKQLSGMYTTDVVANAAFGVQNNTFEDENSLFSQITSEIFSMDTLNGIMIMISFVLSTDFIGFRLSSKKTENILMSLTRQSMKEKVDEGRNDIFQQMKNYRKNDTKGVFTDEYIASHCFGFLADGYETSSDALCFTFFELAWHTPHQERLRNEIMTMVKETNGEYSVEHVEKLKYLDMVVCESLRLHPPLAIFLKKCTNDYKMPNSSLVIKKGTLIGVSPYAIHLDENIFPNAMKFDPERFTDDAIAGRHKYAFLPFGEGPRKCLGQRFALLQVKLAIISVLRNFTLKPSVKSNYPAELDPTFFLSRPLNGAWVHFEEIKN